MTVEAGDGSPHSPEEPALQTWVSFRPRSRDGRHFCCLSHCGALGGSPKQAHSQPSLPDAAGSPGGLTCLQGPKDTLQPVSLTRALPACVSSHRKAELKALLSSRPLWCKLGTKMQARR